MTQELDLEQMTSLPERLTNVDLPQLSYEELDNIHMSELAGKTQDELMQIAESATNATDVLDYEQKNKEYELTYEDKGFIKSSASAMARLFETGKFTVNMRNATAITLATKIFKEVAKGKLSLSYNDYNYILNAMNGDFQGNALTANIINNVFATMGNISLLLANNKARISHYTVLFSHSADYIDKLNAENEAPADEAESPKDDYVLTGDGGEKTTEA